MNLHRTRLRKVPYRARTSESLEARICLAADIVSQHLHQDVPGIGDEVESGDLFGAVIVEGYFDSDEFLDIAIGIPGETDGQHSGAVTVLYGNDERIGTARSQIFTQRNVLGAGILDSGFGASMAVGDFDGDDLDDLAIGIVNASVNRHRNAGAVAVLFGSPRDGLTISRKQIWHQDVPGVADEAENDDHFGATLATGDFNIDGEDDLAIGVPSETVDAQPSAGVVHVLYGLEGVGLTAHGSQFWDHHSLAGNRAKLGDPAENDRLGFSLAAGDLNANGAADLAIGVPGRNVESATAAGAVVILHGNQRQSLRSDTMQLWHQDIRGTEGQAQSDAEFGFALAMGDFDDDSDSDLAVGVPGQQVNGIDEAGAVHVLYSTNQGIQTIDNEIWDQSLEGLEKAETGDRFGSVLNSAELQADNEGDELIVGVPDEDLDAADVGVVHIIGTRAGSSWRIPNAQTIRPSHLGLPEHTNSRFGHAVAAGQRRRPDFLSVIRDPLDLIIGIPGGSHDLDIGGSMMAIYGGIDVRGPDVRFRSRGGTVIGGGVCFAIEVSEKLEEVREFPVEFVSPPGGQRKDCNLSAPDEYFTYHGLTLTTSGRISAHVPAGKFFDAFGNTNDASDIVEVNVIFNIRGEIWLVDEDPEDEEMHFHVRYDHPVSLTTEDITLSGVSEGEILRLESSEAGKKHVITVGNFSREGRVEIVLSPDLAPNIGRNVVMVTEFDRSLPTVVISEGPQSTDDLIHIELNYGRAFLPFDLSELKISGSAKYIEVFHQGGNAWSMDIRIRVVSDGTLTLFIPAGGLSSRGGMASFESNVFTTERNSKRVAVEVADITSPFAQPDHIEYFVKFSEPVTGFTVDDLEFRPQRPTQISIEGEGSHYRIFASGFAFHPKVVSVRPQSVWPKNHPSTFVAERPVSWTNEENALDVNNDGVITPMDAHLIILHLNQLGGSNPRALLPLLRPPQTPFIDTTRDGYVSALDALLIINELSRRNP